MGIVTQRAISTLLVVVPRIAHSVAPRATEARLTLASAKKMSKAASVSRDLYKASHPNVPRSCAKSTKEQ